VVNLLAKYFILVLYLNLLLEKENRAGKKRKKKVSRRLEVSRSFERALQLADNTRCFFSGQAIWKFEGTARQILARIRPALILNDERSVASL
jgi:hypothetical protein